MDPTAAVYVPEERLVVSPAASVEIAAAASDALERAGLERGDFIIVAVPPGGASADLVTAVEDLVRRAPAPATITPHVPVRR